MMRIPYNTIIETRHLYEDAKNSNRIFDKIASRIYKFTMYKICRMLDSTILKTNIIRKEDLLMFGNFLNGANIKLPENTTYDNRGDRYIFTFFGESGMVVSLDTIRPDGTMFYINTKSEYGETRKEVEFVSTSDMYVYDAYEKLIQTIKEYLRRP